MALFENGLSHSQSDSAMAPKQSQSEPKSPSYAKRDPKITSARKVGRFPRVLMPTWKSKIHLEKCVFPVSGPLWSGHEGEVICIMRAIRRLLATFGINFSLAGRSRP